MSAPASLAAHKRKRGPSKQPQTGFDETGTPEQSVSDPELIRAVGEWDDLMGEWESKVKPFLTERTNLRSRIKGLIETLHLEVGTYRVGEYLLTVKAQGGGGFSVPAWTSKTFTLGMFGPGSADGSAATD